MSHINRHGQQIADYRAQTAALRAMPGVMRPSFICKCCGENKGIEGRKMVISKYPKAGWKCRDCVEAGE